MDPTPLNFRAALQRLASDSGWPADSSQSERDAERLFESVPEQGGTTSLDVEKAFMSFQEYFQGHETVCCLEAPGARPVYFHRPVQVRITQAEGLLVCRVHELGIEGRAYTPRMARAEAIRAVRAKAYELNCRLSHTLSPHQRLEKRALLGLVDMAKSGLLDGAEGLAWIVGSVDRDASGKRIFKTLSNPEQEFKLDDSLTPDLPNDGRLVFAQVCTGQAGEPLGPVVTLDDTPVDDQVAVWHAWRQRFDD